MSKICVGLSGGVDSSVAALLLKRQGYDVFAMYMQNWHDTEGTLHGDCEWEEEKTVAELVARKIGIPFYFVDLSGQYRKRVVDYMFDEYARGRTPNPDVMCNSEIKFDAFLETARKMGADCVATGHYCRRAELERADGTVEYRLLEGVDPGKDQSYFLCRLDQEQLSGAVFPIGGMLKSEVRRIAAEAGLPSADRKDSQGICFVGKVDLPVFLQQKLKSVEGDIVEVHPSFYGRYAWREALAARVMADPGGVSDEDLDRLAGAFDYSGAGEDCVRTVGRHIGAQFYTLGQRRGLGVGGHKEPLFVIGTDMESNRVYVGEGESHPGLFSVCARISPDDVHWVRPDADDAPASVMKPGEVRRYRVRVRYREPLREAVLVCRERGLYILFGTPERSVTPGQFAVWYGLYDPDDPDDAPELYGSGVL
ncbi:MAG: tRNA 2-thiouridine(34) synthase MnmA [Bacteroidales bacterium]|nr:tRNA 2-thiouridine(34) synthase MnmA [Bacteroidales bacterium]